MKKILVFTFLTLCLSFYIPTNTFASETKDTNPKIIKAYRMNEEGKAVEINKEEIEKIIENGDRNSESVFSQTNTINTDKNSIVPYVVNPPKTLYYESSRRSDVHKTDARKRVCQPYKNNTSAVQTRTISGTTTFSYTSSVTATMQPKMLSAVQAVVGTTYGVNRSVTDSFTLSVKPGKTVWLEFYPLVTETKGTIVDYYDGINSKSYNVTMHLSQKKLGYLDGVFIAMEK